MPPDETDAELARRVAAGPDPEGAFGLLYARHAHRLLAFLRDRFPGIAEDVAQDAWLRVFAVLRPGMKAMTNFRGLLFEVARNAALDAARKKAAVPLPTDADPPDGRSDSPLAGLLDEERRAVVERCLGKLDPPHRDAIRAAAAGEKPEDTARRLGVGRGVIDQRKHRGLAALRECVKQHLP